PSLERDKSFQRRAWEQHVHHRSFRANRNIKHADGGDAHTIRSGDQGVLKKVVAKLLLRATRKLVASQFIKQTAFPGRTAGGDLSFGGGDGAQRRSRQRRSEKRSSLH